MSDCTFYARWQFLNGFNYSDPCVSLGMVLEKAITESRWGGSHDEDIEIVDQDLNPVLTQAQLGRILRNERKSRGVRRVRLNLTATVVLW